MIRKKIIAGIILVFVLASITSSVAQKNRYLQSITLSAEANLPFFEEQHMLPALILKGIEEGEITPYDINYKENRVEPFGPEAISVLLYDIHPDNPEDFPKYTLRDFNTVVADVTKNKKGLTQVNYLHFTAVSDDAVIETSGEFMLLNYKVFSVRFDEAAAYMDKVGALWVKNAGPILYRNNVLHTANRSPLYLLQKEAENPNYHYVHVKGAAANVPGKLVFYSREHEPLREEELADNRTEGTILYMSDAISQGKLAPAEQQQIKTKVKPVAYKAPVRKMPENYTLTQNYRLYLQLPENAAFMQDGNELPALILEAVEQNWISNLYPDETFKEKISKKQWNANREADTGFSLFGEEEDSTLEKTYYFPQSFNVVTLTNKIDFTRDGSVKKSSPRAIGLALNAAETPEGMEKTLGFVAFDELYKAIKANGTDAQLELLNKLRDQSYFSYLDKTSEVSIASEK